MRALVPGLLVAAAGCAVSLVATLLPVPVSALLVALVLGAALRAAGVLPASTGPGLAWAARRPLRLGVVLLGLGLSVPAVLALGVRGVVVVVVTVVATATATLAAGRALGVPPVLRTLVAAGFSICGAAAVVATAAVVDPDGDHEEDVGVALALVTAFGTVTLVALPLVAGLLGLDDATAGIWIGASVHEVAQVVAAGGAVSAAALGAAAATKLGRVVLLAPFVAVVGVARRRGARDDAVAGRARSQPPLVPLFVVGFLAAVALRASGLLPDGVLDVAATVTTVLLATAMVALGTGVDVRRLARGMRGRGSGPRAAALAAVATGVAVVVPGVLLLLW